MVEVPAEIKNVIEQQEASLQRIAMWIIGLPRENRPAAINLARTVFEETFQQGSLNQELARKWVDLNVERLHARWLDMEAGGGRGHA
ncbi:MAG: hypothetical protein ACLQU2_14370 [Candidatus Binataceae bacterium]